MVSIQLKTVPSIHKDPNKSQQGLCNQLGSSVERRESTGRRFVTKQKNEWTTVKMGVGAYRRIYHKATRLGFGWKPVSAWELLWVQGARINSFLMENSRHRVMFILYDLG